MFFCRKPEALSAKKDTSPGPSTQDPPETKIKKTYPLNIESLNPNPNIGSDNWQCMMRHSSIGVSIHVGNIHSSAGPLIVVTTKLKISFYVAHSNNKQERTTLCGVSPPPLATNVLVTSISKLQGIRTSTLSSAFR